MELLNSLGNIVDDATSIIDNYFAFDESRYSNIPITDIPCSESETERILLKTINNVLPVRDNSDASAILSYSPKIYGELSRKLVNLDDSFRPFAECIVAFIDQWCSNGGVKDGRVFGYEICSTKRSWFVQQNIITGNQYRDNGLSWSLYGKSISINVYYLEDDQLSELSGVVSKVKKQINFEDGTAKTFIEDAQSWFNSHKTRTGVNVKVYGVYPDLETAIKTDKNVMEYNYRKVEDTVFWGGLFSTYSNFTTWEYHPGLMPNEVWKPRQSFLNSSFVDDGNENIVDRIDAFESITYSEAESTLSYNPLTALADLITGTKPVEIIKYLSTTLEIMEEDFISLYNLKVNINTSSSYPVLALFKWAVANQYSLKQTILNYRLSGDTKNSSLFYLISQNLSEDILVASDDTPSMKYGTAFKIVEDDGSFYLSCKDMFGDDQLFSITSTYKLPCDYMPDSADFDLIDFPEVDSSDDNSVNPGNQLDGTSVIGKEITDMAATLKGNDGVNEFGPISGIEIDPRKALYNADAIAKSIFRAKNYNEMITPPDSHSIPKSTAILDVTTLGKRFVASKTSKVNEMIQPDRV